MTSYREAPIPKLGLGTWRMSGDACRAAVEGAIARGYRHIDTAEMYGNEEAIGVALAATLVPRSDLFLTSKVWWEHLHPAAIRRAFDQSLQKLRTEYLDLYLIHWPAPGMDLPAALETMMGLRETGRVRAIGVSNFPVALLKQAIEDIRAPIACNQIEFHVLLDQSKVLAYARAHGVTVTAYRPLGGGQLLDHPVLQRIAARHDASAAQVALKWLLEQDGVAAVPKAARAPSQQANLDALAIALDDDDRAAIAALPKDRRYVDPGWAPDWD